MMTSTSAHLDVGPAARKEATSWLGSPMGYASLRNSLQSAQHLAAMITGPNDDHVVEDERSCRRRIKSLREFGADKNRRAACSCEISLHTRSGVAMMSP